MGRKPNYGQNRADVNRAKQARKEVPAARVAAIADPLSRLVAAAVLLRAERATDAIRAKFGAEAIIKGRALR